MENTKQVFSQGFGFVITNNISIQKTFYLILCYHSSLTHERCPCIWMSWSWLRWSKVRLWLNMCAASPYRVGTRVDTGRPSLRKDHSFWRFFYNETWVCTYILPSTTSDYALWGLIPRRQKKQFDGSSWLLTLMIKLSSWCAPRVGLKISRLQVSQLWKTNFLSF